MIAPTDRRRKGPLQIAAGRSGLAENQGQIRGHGIVSRILLLPNFCQPTAPLDCEKESLRWPGPFGSGFLSPQPPGAVGIGPVAGGVKSPLTDWANESWSFFFLGMPDVASTGRTRSALAALRQ